MLVLKFGGTSVGNARRVRESARIALTRPGPMVLVVSACGGVTNLLLEAGRAAARADVGTMREHVAAIHDRHSEVISGIGSDNIRIPLQSRIDELHASLEDALGAILLAGTVLPELSDRLVSHGEKCMARMMAATLSDMGAAAQPVYTDRVLATDGRHTAARPDRERTRDAARTQVLPVLDSGQIAVATGFIGFGPDGATTTLGRGGSDYSATLLAAAIDATEVQIWTDVPGVLSADPRKVPTARVVSDITYDEAQELAHFGAKVLHPRTIRPAVSQHIPVRILSTFQPTNAGTVVHTSSAPAQRIKAITALKGLTLITMDVPELEDLAGAASAIFRVLHEEQTEIVSVAQASSRRRMTFIVDTLSLGCAALQPRLAAEFADLEVDISCQDNVAVVAAVGEGAASSPASLSQMMSVLSREHVDVLSTNQQSSNAAMVAVVRDDASDRAVKLLHDSFIGSSLDHRRRTSRRRSDIMGESLRVG